MKHLIYNLILCLISCSIFSQEHINTITGIVVDEKNNNPLEFCTVALLKKSDSSLLGGSVTNFDGKFVVTTKQDDIIIRVSFIGYKDLYLDNININKGGETELSKIKLSIDLELLEGVDVVGEKSEVYFKLDKRVFNVGKDLSQSGGSAIDVLNNVPSVEVTLEGIIQLRGNSGVQILINGKPSVLADESSNALGSISSDMIESIEVITSPSAKYDAEGTVGIINIILKSGQKKGINGSVTLNIGTPNNHSLGLSVSYRSEKINVFSQIGLGTRRFLNIDSSKNYNYENNTIFYTYGDGNKNENFANIRLGSDFYIDSLNTITISSNYAYELENHFSTIKYLLEENNNINSNFWRKENTYATNPKSSFDIHYQKKFKRNKEQLLDLGFLSSFFGKDKRSIFDNIHKIGNDIGVNQRTQIEFKDQEYIVNLDYIHPISKKWKNETGAKYETSINNNNSNVYNYKNLTWNKDTIFSNNFNYKIGIMAYYTTLSYEGDKWGAKGGVRLEQTNATANKHNEKIGNWNYINLFPSFHTSYKLSDNLSSQLGYSRRINRPSLFSLSPYFSFTDNYNLRTGNPNLQPEFSDLFELTVIKKLEKTSINTSIYASKNYDVIENIVVINNNKTTVLPENIGTSSNVGLELNTKISPIKKVSIFLDGNISYFKREGNYNEQVFNFENYKWYLRGNLKLKLPYKIELQTSINYNSKVKYVFTEREEYLYVNGGIRKKMKDGKFIANLSVRDIFNSRINRTIIKQTGSYIYKRNQRGRYIVLGISYNFGKGDAMEFSGHKMF